MRQVITMAAAVVKSVLPEYQSNARCTCRPHYGMFAPKSTVPHCGFCLSSRMLQLAASWSTDMPGGSDSHEPSRSYVSALLGEVSMSLVDNQRAKELLHLSVKGVDGRYTESQVCVHRCTRNVLRWVLACWMLFFRSAHETA